MSEGHSVQTGFKRESTGVSERALLDDNGLLKVAIASGGGTGGTASDFGALFPATGTAAGASDGTNMVPLKVDGSGALLVSGSSSGGGIGAEVTGTATGPAVLIASTNVAANRWVSLQVSGVWGGILQADFEISNDNSTWVSVALTAAGDGSKATSAQTNGIWYGEAPAKYFRVNIASWGSPTGTVAGRAEFFTSSGAYVNQDVNTLASASNQISGQQKSQLYDAINLTTATVLPVSTAASASDNPVVVAQHPSSTGKVTVQNSTGAAAVNVQDGGNSITVDGTVATTQGAAGTNAQAWWARIGDATNGPAAVKAATADPTTSDPALVVALSPNGVLPRYKTTTSFGSATGATAAGTSIINLNTVGYATAIVSVYPHSLTGGQISVNAESVGGGGTRLPMLQFGQAPATEQIVLVGQVDFSTLANKTTFYAVPVVGIDLISIILDNVLIGGTLSVGVDLTAAEWTTYSAVGLTNWLGSTAPTVGQKTKVASLPVVLASDQDALALPTGAATAARQDTSNASLANLDVGLSTRLKPADTLTKVATVDTITNPVTVTGALTNAALETGGNLATLVTQTLPLATAQGAAVGSLTGPLVQGVTTNTNEAFADSVVQPLSLAPDGSLRVVPTRSLDSEILLQILANLRAMNIQLGLMGDTYVDPRELMDLSIN